MCVCVRHEGIEEGGEGEARRIFNLGSRMPSFKRRPLYLFVPCEQDCGWAPWVSSKCVAGGPDRGTSATCTYFHRQHPARLNSQGTFSLV